MRSSESELIKYLKKLIKEATEIAPSISHFVEEGKYGKVTDNEFNADKYVRWDIEIRVLLKKLSEKDIVKYGYIYSEYHNILKESIEFHSKSIVVHKNVNFF